MNEKSKRSKNETIQTTLDILRDSNDRVLQEIHHLSTKRRLREEASYSSSQSHLLSDLTNIANINTPTLHSTESTLKKRKVMTPLRDSLQPPIARQLFLEKDKVHITELSSDEDEKPPHPQIQGMSSFYFPADIGFATIQKTMADIRGICVQAVCDILNFEHDVKFLSCANTNMFALSCQNKLAVIKRCLHPPDTFGRDITWKTPDNKLASAASRVLHIPCLDEEHNRRTTTP